MQEFKVDKQTLCQAIANKLCMQYFGNTDAVTAACINWFAGADTRFDNQWCSSLVAGVKGIVGQAEYVDRRILTVWLKSSQPIRKVFRTRKRIEFSADVLKRLNSNAKEWPVPKLENQSDLCELLGVTHNILDWLCLPHTRRASRTKHYMRRALTRKSGQVRWVESPKPALKQVQRQILNRILEHIPLHQAAFAYRKGKSIANCAAQHVGKQVVLRMDLSDFFGSITYRRVVSLFRAAGYCDDVANCLARLTVASAQVDAADAALRKTRLPQGAPSSPAIANAVAFRLDRRLAGLAKQLGLTYTRYSDDLIFSGDETLYQRLRNFKTSVAAIALEEGFLLQYRKTTVTSQARRQKVLGLTVNCKLNTPRPDYDQLRAILYNCRIHGWRTQAKKSEVDFRSHLQGRISYVASTNPGRGKRLEALFRQIAWD